MTGDFNVGRAKIWSRHRSRETHVEIEERNKNLSHNT